MKTPKECRNNCKNCKASKFSQNKVVVNKQIAIIIVANCLFMQNFSEPNLLF